MKTKIVLFLFTTSLFFSLNIATEIGGPTIPPKPPTGPAFQSANSERDIFKNPETHIRILNNQ